MQTANKAAVQKCGVRRGEVWRPRHARSPPAEKRRFTRAPQRRGTAARRCRCATTRAYRGGYVTHGVPGVFPPTPKTPHPPACLDRAAGPRTATPPRRRLRARSRRLGSCLAWREDPATSFVRPTSSTGADFPPALTGLGAPTGKHGGSEAVATRESIASVPRSEDRGAGLTQPLRSAVAGRRSGRSCWRPVRGGRSVDCVASSS